MPEIQPFAGIRFNPEAVGNIASVVAPPYDVIDAPHHARLLDRSPFNCVRLDLGISPGKPGDYASEARRMQKWLDEGVLRRDTAPSYYLIEDSFLLPGEAQPRRRWGIIGRVRLEPLDTGRIHPHERTHKGPKEDRLRSMRAFHGNLSQVFALFDGDASSVKAVLKGAFASPPAAAFTDAEGIERRMWVVSDTATVRSLSSMLSERDYYIADGHHRYETALAYSQEMASADPDPNPAKGYKFLMMALVGMQDPGLAILPTHRLLHGFDGFSFGKLRNCLSEAFEISEADPAVAASFRAGSAPARWGRRGFHLYDPSSDRLLRAEVRPDVDLGRAIPGLPKPVRELEVTLVERLVMMKCLGMTAEQISHQDHLEYYKDLQEATERARSGGHVLVVMSPTDMQDLVSVTGARERMPQKSTFFYPKLLTGLVFYSHETAMK